MSYSVQARDALKGAIAKGVRMLKMDGEWVEFRSLAEMKSILSDIEAELAGQVPGAVSISYPKTTRGL